MPEAAAIEALVVRRDATLDAERAAAAAGRWAAFLETRVPPPPVWQVRARAAWREAFDAALAIGAASVTREVVVCPLWFCSNDDDIPGSKWEPAVVVAFDDGTFELHERKSVDAIVVATVEQARLGFLVRSRDYAPEIPLALRNDHFGAIESRRIERVTGIVREVESAAAPVPERDLPPFATDAAPARVPGDPAIAARLDVVLAKLRVFPDGPETLVAPLRRR